MQDTKATNKKTSAKVRKWLQGQWMVQYVPFILFLALLAVAYIGNGHFADNAIRNTGKATRELKQLQYEYKTLQSEVIYRSKESELAKAVAPLGLDRTQEPPSMLTPDTNAAK